VGLSHRVDRLASQVLLELVTHHLYVAPDLPNLMFTLVRITGFGQLVYKPLRLVFLHRERCSSDLVMVRSGIILL